MNRSQVIHVVTEAVVLALLTAWMVKRTNKTNEDVAALRALIAKQEETNALYQRHINQLYTIVENLQQALNEVLKTNKGGGGTGSGTGRRESYQPQVPTSPPTPMFSSSSSLPSQSPLHPHSLPPFSAHQGMSNAIGMANAMGMGHAMMMGGMGGMAMHDPSPHSSQHPSSTAASSAPPANAQAEMLSTIMHFIPTMMPLMTPGHTSIILEELNKPLPDAPKATVEVMNEEDDPDVLAALEDENRSPTVPSSPASAPQKTPSLPTSPV